MDYLVFIIVALLQSYKRCVSVSVEGGPVDSTVKLASEMTLKCVFPKTSIVSQMSWMKQKSNNKEKIAVFRPPFDLHIQGNYTDRVRVVNHMLNNKSLVFNYTTEADIGFYLCSFQAFPYGIWEKRIQVVQSGDFQPEVLPALHVVTEPGSNVIFACLYDPELTVNKVIWEKVQVDCVDLVVQCVPFGTSVYGSDYQDRVEIDCATQANSTMLLWNVTALDSGIYRCHYTGANGSNLSWTKLIVNFNGPAPLDYEHNVFFIIGGAAGATVLLMIILAIVVTILHCRKRKRKRIMMMKAHHGGQKASNRCGKSNYHCTVRACREANAKAPKTMKEAIYVNYRGCSHKPNMGV
ncbi:CD226 antigen [Hemicordylus capensis]|uniref:CD226 antigen n=1 Tax=Hemicordylus capensis TaxID=884348 RepID=UPI00230228CA|nr:CD226 antigen [Hemicordylus capensis]